MEGGHVRVEGGIHTTEDTASHHATHEAWLQRLCCRSPLHLRMPQLQLPYFRSQPLQDSSFVQQPPQPQPRPLFP